MGLGTGIVNVGHIGDGGDFGTGALAQNVNEFQKRRTDEKMQALGLAKEHKNNLKKRYINNAVSNVLSMKPKPATMESEGEDGYTIAPQPEESPDDFSFRVKHEMGKIHDMDPMVALGLSQKITQPYREQSNADRLFGFNETKESNLQTYRDDTLNQQDTNSKRSFNKGKFKTFTDDYGKSWKYNSNTGDMEEINTGTGSGNMVPGSVKSKNIVLKEIEYKDGNGNVVKEQVPVNKITGNVVVDGVDSGKPATTTQRPVPTQADRDAAVAGQKAVSALKDIESLYRPDLVGSFDNAAAWVANVTGTAQKGGDSQANYKLDQSIQNLRANLTSALIKGVPSDADLNMITKMLPNTTDSEEVFKSKLKNIRRILTEQQGISQEAGKKRGQGDMYNIDGPNTTKSKSGRDVVEINGKFYYK